MNFFSKAIAPITYLFNGWQVKRFFAVVLAGFLVLTTQVDSVRHYNTSNEQNRDSLHQIDSVRPKTTGEWNQEAQETADSPGERLQKIAEESGTALKEFASMYPDTAKRSVEELKENTARAD